MFRKSVTFRVFLALIALLVLQWFPVTGIFLIFLLSPLWAGILVHVILISLLIEAFVGRLPRFLMIVPLAAYGWYYKIYFDQSVQISQKSAEMRASNPGKVFDFDPKLHSLVTTRGAYVLVSQYEIPVAYESRAEALFAPEGYLSYRLITRDRCDVRKDSQNRISTLGVHFDGVFQTQVCMLEFPEAPPNKIVTVVRRGDDEVWEGKHEISEQATEISVDGVIVGSFARASVLRLPVLPVLWIGCAPESSGPGPRCGAIFVRSPMTIDAYPDGVDRARLPESIMLGIRKYAASDLANFRGFEQNDPALARVAQEPKRIENDAFTTLQAIVDRQNPKPPSNMGYSIARDPDRLVPFAESMARRFVELDQSTVAAAPNRGEQLTALAIGMVALPRAAFADISKLIFTAARQTKRDVRERQWPVLYVRAGEAGAETFEFYKSEFMADNLLPSLRMLPVLAICRIGTADQETITEMKRRFVLSSHDALESGYTSALAVALMKLGQESFLKENVQSIDWRHRGWMEAVLANKGTTEAGPNNCMGETDWGTMDYLGPMMEPSLRRRGNGEWAARAQQ
jgi:hypothetical protein